MAGGETPWFCALSAASHPLDQLCIAGSKVEEKEAELLHLSKASSVAAGCRQQFPRCSLCAWYLPGPRGSFSLGLTGKAKVQDVCASENQQGSSHGIRWKVLRGTRMRGETVVSGHDQAITLFQSP